jgi:CubicO group peptidase (beta-lactamase class C family)
MGTPNGLLRILAAATLAPIIVLAPVGCWPSADSTGPANLAPDVVITSPLKGQVFEIGDTVPILVDASDADGRVLAVRFYIDGEQCADLHAAPYALYWDTEGEPFRYHRIRVVAVDDRGRESAALVDIHVVWAYTPPQETDDGWETADLADVGISLGPLAELIKRLRTLPDTLVHGILIIKDRKLVFEEYFRGIKYTGSETIQFDRDTIHNIASITKTVTSALLGIAIDRGLIDSVDLPAHTFFPEIEAFQSEGKDEITLEHLITMTSSLEWDQNAYDLRDRRNDIVLFYTAPNPIEYYVSRPLVAAPGTFFAYSEASINTVARAIEHASGVELDEFAQEFLFSPLGISRVLWLRIWPGTWVWASGNLEMRPRDMAKFGQLYLDGGVWAGEQVVSREWVEASTRPYYSWPDGSGYGYAWWMGPRSGLPAYWGSGLGGQKIYVVPDLALVVVITGGSYWVPAVTPPDYMMDHYILPAVRGTASGGVSPGANGEAN